jgi:hypothetical protein
MTFLPTDYEIPKSPSGYMKFEDGLNKIRILSSAIVGFEYFTKDNKPVRSKEPFEDEPTDIKQGGKVKPFWAFGVWNYATKTVQILELTQKTIMRALKIKIDNRNGKAQDYDFIITKSGENLETEYDVDVDEATPIEPEIVEAYKVKPIKLEALYKGEDPFKV